MFLFFTFDLDLLGMSLGFYRNMSSQCGEHLYKVISDSTQAFRSVGVYRPDKICDGRTDKLTNRQTDRQTDGQCDYYMPPCGGIKIVPTTRICAKR